MNIHKIVLILCVAIPSLVIAHIKETASLMDVLNEYKKDDLIMLDIDCTLTIPEHGYIGSDPWFGYLMQRHNYDIPQTVADYAIGVFSIWMKPAGPETQEFIKQLRKKKIPTIGFTARNNVLATRTEMQLEHINLQLGIGNVPHNNFTLYTHDKGAPSIYMNGTLYCGSNDKADILPQFLKKLPKKPKRILFADDKIKNLKTVEDVAKKEDIAFVGFRYSGCDIYVKQFDSAAKECTNKEFKKLRDTKPCSLCK